ncbi:hypothetical protein ACN4EK_32465 [Pantanalinema rosaneae CENA516]|uniref:hypothetical protein n=1 Tax=Pantanalinema rosaneae TaxID=1620701 RepID=UPI003D6FBA72
MKTRDMDLISRELRDAAPETDLLSAIAGARQQAGEAQASDPRLWRTTVRLPREIRADLRIIAETQGVKVNALIAAAVDALLAENGRRGICEAAPWYAAYLTRQGNRAEDGDDLPPP